jgi:hypothetical protein
MFQQTQLDLILLSNTFKKELAELTQKGYRIGGKPEQTFLFKLDGTPSLYSPAPTSPFYFFIRDSDIMSFENVNENLFPVDKSDYAI